MGARLIAVLAAALLSCCVARGKDEAPRAPPERPSYALADKPAPYPLSVVANAACVLDGRIYVTGGYGGRDKDRDAELLKQSWRYDPRSNHWERLPDMPEACCFHATAASEGKVFVFGGLGEGSSRENVMAFDAKAGRWAVVAKMLPPRNRFAAASVGQKIYIIAGMETREHLENTSVVDVFDAANYTWSRGPELPASGHGHALAVAGQTLIVAGGLGDLKQTWLLDTVEGKWRQGAPLAKSNLFASAAVVDGSMYVVGNRDDLPVPLIRYDPTADTWEQVAPASVEVHRAAGVALDGLIYIIGGEGPKGWEVSRVSRYDPASGVWAHSD